MLLENDNEDISNIIDQENKRAEDRIRNDTPGLLNQLQEYFNDEESFVPIGILEVLDVSVNTGVKSDKTSVKCRVACSDGKSRVFLYSESSYSGGYWDPPDWDCSCLEIAEE